ncbi:hypothetical protein [Paracoccus sp. TOH]|uniref:hypothetical protein n=1 Tax=Paracoccus sp. TOH TaxID=1263728 RepID=UPI0025B06735|nr:hypothetical protein [Paracoccus sp. TOH]WJS85884.1 hypothetical protein NBE95_10715 [Paracoccus sp. TOH]
MRLFPPAALEAVLLAAPFILCFMICLQCIAKQVFLIFSPSVPPWYRTGMGAALAWAIKRPKWCDWSCKKRECVNQVAPQLVSSRRNATSPVSIA